MSLPSSTGHDCRQHGKGNYYHFYRDEMDWAYLEKKAALPENNTLAELKALKEKRGRPA
jgi:hypothetical protein